MFAITREFPKHRMDPLHDFIEDGRGSMGALPALLGKEAGQGAHRDGSAYQSPEQHWKRETRLHALLC